MIGSKWTSFLHPVTHIRLHSQDSCFPKTNLQAFHRKNLGACQTAQQWEFCFIFFESLGSQRVVDLVPWSRFGSLESVGIPRLTNSVKEGVTLKLLYIYSICNDYYIIYTPKKGI